jgi:hypothetical protein
MGLLLLALIVVPVLGTRVATGIEDSVTAWPNCLVDYALRDDRLVVEAFWKGGDTTVHRSLAHPAGAPGPATPTGD